MPAYSASKHGIIGLAKSAGVQGAPLGIRVNAVAPGLIDTSMQTGPGGTGGAAPGLGTLTNPSHRLGTADEVAALVAFLLSDDAPSSPAPSSRSTVARPRTARTSLSYPPDPQRPKETRMRYLMIAQTTPLEGRDDEFNAWYNGEHLKDVLAVPGFVSAERFEVASGEAPFKYYAIYEVEAGTDAEIWAAVPPARDDVDDRGSRRVRRVLLAPIGSRVTSADFTNAPAG
ncbi:SDR family oxidoreductase [Actinacidiphila oryziradicis]|nr:SDR family oxidoreductase [Actinacidiphila oryziradicis]